MTERLYLIERRDASVASPSGLLTLRHDFSVLGSTGNVYEVSICREPKCTCARNAGPGSGTMPLRMPPGRRLAGAHVDARDHAYRVCAGGVTAVERQPDLDQRAVRRRGRGERARGLMGVLLLLLRLALQTEGLGTGSALRCPREHQQAALRGAAWSRCWFPGTRNNGRSDGHRPTLLHGEAAEPRGGDSSL